jgi:hypothetical protein
MKELLRQSIQFASRLGFESSSKRKAQNSIFARNSTLFRLPHAAFRPISDGTLEFPPI